MAAIEVNKEIFDEKTKSGLSLVDFYADWCGPCKMQGPLFEELSNEIDHVNFLKVNIDNNQGIAGEYSIASIPTILLLKDGQVVETMVGLQKKEILKSAIEKQS